MARPRALARQARAHEPDAPALAQASPLAAVPLDLASAQPERSPARQVLALAIDRVAAAEAESREAGAAIEPAREATWAAQRALDAAEAVLKDARPRETYLAPPSPSYSYWGSQAEADDAARARTAAAAAPPISVADAKAAVEVAKDALDSARRTRQWHEDRHRTAEQRVGMYRSNVRDAIRAVLREDPALLALAQESRRASTYAEALRRAFDEATSGEPIQSGSPFYGAGKPAWENQDPEGFAPLYAWRAAIEALASDPDAPLPTTPAA